MAKLDTNVEELLFVPVGTHNSDKVISSAASLSTPSGATKLMIQTITQNVRFTLDGTTPTTSVGFQMVAGDPPIILPVSTFSSITLIEEAATASLQYQYGR